MASRIPSYARTVAKAVPQRTSRMTASSVSQKLRPIHIPTDHQDNFNGAASWNQNAAAAAAAGVSGFISSNSASAVPAIPSLPSLPSLPSPQHHDQQLTHLPQPQNQQLERVLAKLPNADLLRSIVLQAVMSRPLLMDVASSVLRSNLERLTGNALCKFVLDNMFYVQFCAGRTEAEIRQTITNLASLGYKGVMLSYAKEVDSSSSSSSSSSSNAKANPEALHHMQVAQWLDGTLRTIQYAKSGDFAAIKFSGAGQTCVNMLEAGSKPDAIMAEALDSICQYAKDRGVKLAVDAEHYSQKKGIDAWTVDMMQKYNKDNTLVVYNTYQMYLKESTATLAEHLQLAEKNNFALGVKLVRGAYIKSDPRHLIHDTKQDTDKAFDDASYMLATQHLNNNPAAPKVGIILASHNKESMDMMRKLRREQVQNGLPLADVVYAQLMGMADELSMGLTQKSPDGDEDAQVFKYVVWGTTEECMMYLLRRAEENKDAIERSALSKQALWEELRGRLLSA